MWIMKVVAMYQLSHKVIHNSFNSAKDAICEGINRILFRMANHCITARKRNEIDSMIHSVEQSKQKEALANHFLEHKEILHDAIKSDQLHKVKLEELYRCAADERSYYYSGLQAISVAYLEGNVELIQQILVAYGLLEVISKE